MYTLGDLINELQPRLWPQGEQENLVASHRQMMIEALIDLQTWVQCLQINNVTVVPQCDTLFKCGYTVLDAPRGRIKRLYTLDKINQTTGLEDATAPTDYCSDITYRQVEFADLDRYVSQTLAGTVSLAFWTWAAWANLAGLVAFPTIWWSKYRTYPPPTDAGLQNAPPLPLGTHYAQTSTDSPNGLRASWGMWALQGGQIFVAPWIQSTETIVIEWDGLKRNWTNIDQVDNDPNLIKAVEWYVRWQHALKYDRDYEAANAAVAGYNEARAVLIHECREENEIRDARIAVNSKARGAALAVDVFGNNPQTATATCPTGTTGTSVTYTVPTNTVASTISQADADAKAKSLALQSAGQQLVCVPVVVTYRSAPVTAQAQCPAGGIGSPVTITLPAGAITSTVSQADADAKANVQAQQLAQASLVCQFANDAVTVNCPGGGTQTIPAGQFTSLTKDLANQQALAAANLACAKSTGGGGGGGPFFNTPQQGSASVHCKANPSITFPVVESIGSGTATTDYDPVLQVITCTVTVPAGIFTSFTSLVDANQLAQNWCNQAATSVAQGKCGFFATQN